jgi:hypothetical protein
MADFVQKLHIEDALDDSPQVPLIFRFLLS